MTNSEEENGNSSDKQIGSGSASNAMNHYKNSSKAFVNMLDNSALSIESEIHSSPTMHKKDFSKCISQFKKIHNQS